MLQAIYDILNRVLFNFEGIDFTVYMVVKIILPAFILFNIGRWLVNFSRKKDFFLWRILGKSGRLVAFVFKVLCITTGLSIGFKISGVDASIFEYTYKILFHPFASIGSSSISLITILLLIVIIYVSVYVASHINEFLKRDVFPQTKLDQGIKEIINAFTKYFIIVTGTLIGLQINGIDLSAFATIGAGLMVGLGFGLQNIANNFVSGVIILLERPIKVGDYVEMEGLSGEVLSISSRSTKIKNLQNIILIVPNSKFVSENVINWSHNDRLVKVIISIGISYKSDPFRAKEVLLHLASEHQSVLQDPLPDVLLKEFGDSSIQLDLHVWIDNPLARLKVTSDINFLIFKRFKEEGIEIPFPQLDVHFQNISKSDLNLSRK